VRLVTGNPKLSKEEANIIAETKIGGKNEYLAKYFEQEIPKKSPRKKIHLRRMHAKNI
jgi:hypothetical protein